MEEVTYKKILKKKGFPFYLTAEFLGALNDNILRMILGLMALEVGLDHGAQDVVSSLGVSAVGAVFILPYLLFSGVAGHLADVYNKRKVLIVTKTLEVFTMLLGLVILPLDIFWLSLLLLFLLATQAAFFSPAKYGILPEIFSERSLSRANGIVEMTTYSAIIFGLFIGGLLYHFFQAQKLYIACFLMLIALIGWAAIFWAPHTPYPGTAKRMSMNPWETIISGVKKILVHKRLILTVSGIIWFWFLGALLNSLLLLLGKEIMGLDNFWIANLLVFLGGGIAVGCLLAGRLSGDHIEIGLVPMGAVGIGLSTILLNIAVPNYTATSISLAFIGLSAGLFIVPLNANLQFLAGIHEKGKLIATTNVFSMGAVFLASAVLPILHDVFGLLSDTIILLIGLLTIAATAYAAFLMPMVLLRCAIWVLLHSLYTIRVRGRHNIPESGPALLVSNHVSYLDGFLIGGALNRHIWFMLIDFIYHIKFLKKFFKMMNVIPVYRGRKVIKTFEMARQALQKGELVCIFSEGGISRNGHILPFRKGLEKIVEGLSVPIIPVNLDNVWGSVFSYDKGKFFFKMPKRFPYPVTVSFGKPLPPGTSKEVVRQAVKELETDAVPLRDTVQDLLPRRFIKSARSIFWKVCMVDSTGVKMRYGGALIASIMMSHKICQKTLGEEMIGILLPASVGGALANLAVSLTGKISVNLNFTSGEEAFESAIQQCKLKTIITSGKFIEKINISKRKEMIFLEDINTSIALRDQIRAFLIALLPTRIIFRLVREKNISPSSVATILFSSGSTGTPKGIMLSHKNILCNIEGAAQVIPYRESDKIVGVMPLFHSFGYTVTLWLAFIKKMTAIYHGNPLDAKTVCKMIDKHKGTIIIGTPTFYQLYARSCSSEQLKTLRLVISGAEKLREPIAKEFHEKFGLKMYEGYGCTELSPVVSVNVPDTVVPSDGWRQIGHKSGTVGAAMTGVATKVVDPETMEELPLGTPGMLLVKSGGAMVGYLHQPEMTREAFYGSWYITGDIAKVDEGGFITIIDRLSRFSKIGGEMVPHIKIEDKINAILGGRHSIITTASSSRKGEVLAVIYEHDSVTERELWEKLKATDLPNLWIPKSDAFIRVDELPLMANGKVNLMEARKIAQARVGS